MNENAKQGKSLSLHSNLNGKKRKRTAVPITKNNMYPFYDSLNVKLSNHYFKGEQNIFFSPNFQSKSHNNQMTNTNGNNILFLIFYMIELQIS